MPNLFMVDLLGTEVSEEEINILKLIKMKHYSFILLTHRAWSSRARGRVTGHRSRNRQCQCWP